MQVLLRTKTQFILLDYGATSSYVFKPCPKGKIVQGSHIFLCMVIRGIFASRKIGGG